MQSHSNTTGTIYHHYHQQLSHVIISGSGCNSITIYHCYHSQVIISTGFWLLLSFKFLTSLETLTIVIYLSDSFYRFLVLIKLQIPNAPGNIDHYYLCK